jgi:hypothetical protein
MLSQVLISNIAELKTPRRVSTSITKPYKVWRGKFRRGQARIETNY